MSQISKKKAAENTPYQPSEELYQALFEQAADGIFIANEQGNYVEVNQRGCDMLGYTREEILNLSMRDLIPANDLTHDPLQLDALRAGKTLLKERYLRCKNGRLLPVEISAQMLADGRFLGIVRDITEHKQAEEELQQNRAAALRFSEQLATLQEITNELSRAESSDDLYRLAVQLGRSRMGFDRVSIRFIDEHLGIMRGSFGTN
ncbi:MAG: PAS domain S-box protein, partial [Anaerolineae bacterium]